MFHTRKGGTEASSAVEEGPADHTSPGITQKASRKRHQTPLASVEPMHYQKCGKCFLLIKFCLARAYPDGASATFTGRLREEPNEIRDQPSQPPRLRGFSRRLDARRRDAFGTRLGSRRDHPDHRQGHHLFLLADRAGRRPQGRQGPRHQRAGARRPGRDRRQRPDLDPRERRFR